MKNHDAINGKTPDEIKKGLECYIVDFCDDRGCEKCVRNIYTRYEIGCDIPIKNALAYIQQLESRQQWISIKDDLPKEKGKYWTCLYDFEERKAFVLLNTWQGSEPGYPKFINEQCGWAKGGTCRNITHWMPLAYPEIPDVEDIKKVLREDWADEEFR